MADLLARARRERTPLIDGDRATFVWRGATAPRLIGDFSDWDAKPLTLRRVAPGLWSRSIDFYRDAYVEYAFVGPRGRVADPFNRREVWNGIDATNHYFAMPRYSPTPFARRRADVRPGTITRHDLGGGFFADGPRSVHLYAPAASGPWPLLVVLDGDDYLRRARLATIVDNLVAEQGVRPFAMAFIHHGGATRVLEYACNDATLALLLERLLPLARERLRLLRTRGAHAILGASMGGLMALYAGLRAPEVFGRVLSQSGAFAIGKRDFAVFDLVRALPRRAVRIWMDVGHLEQLQGANRRMRAALGARGYEVTCREYHAGHNWTAWRDEVARGLVALFPA